MGDPQGGSRRRTGTQWQAALEAIIAYRDRTALAAPSLEVVREMIDFIAGQSHRTLWPLPPGELGLNQEDPTPNQRSFRLMKESAAPFTC